MPNFGPYPDAMPLGAPITTADILAKLNGGGLGLLTPQSDPTKRPIAPQAMKPRAMPSGPNGQTSASGYTPEQVLKSQADTANWYQSRPLAPMAGGSTPAMIAGGIANVGNGFMSTYLPTKAEEKMQANQALSEKAMKDALGSKDLSGMMTSLAGSGNPKYQDMAAQLMLQRGVAQEDQRQKMETWSRLLSDDGPLANGNSGATAAAPPAAAVAPGAIQPGMDTGAAMGLDAQTPPPAPATAQPQAAPAEEPVVFRPPPRGPLGSMERKIIAAQMAGMPKEVAERLDQGRHANEAQDKETGKGYGERFQKIMSGRDAAYQRQGDLQLLEHLTLNPDTLMGPASESISVRLRRGLAALGVPTSELQSLNATQLYQGLMGKMALEARNPANGAGMPGAMSDSDREFLQKITGGMPNTREANIAMVKVHQLQAQRQLDVAKNAAEYAANNNGRLDVHFDRLQEKWAKQNPLFKEKDFATLFDTTPPGQAGAAAAPQPGAQPTAQAAAPAPPEFIASATQVGIPKEVAGTVAEGQTITNKRTGIQYVRQNGQLVEVPLDGSKPPEQPSFSDIMTMGDGELKAKAARWQKYQEGQKGKTAAAPATPPRAGDEMRMMLQSGRGELR